MKLRKLYDTPGKNGFYFCLCAEGNIKLARFFSGKWYAQFGTGKEIPSDKLSSNLEQLVMWLDEGIKITIEGKNEVEKSSEYPQTEKFPKYRGGCWCGPMTEEELKEHWLTHTDENGIPFKNRIINKGF